VHRATLPTGRQALVSFPALGPLTRANAVPDELRDMVLKEMLHPVGAAHAVAQEVREVEDSQARWELAARLSGELLAMYTWLVAEHVLVEPKLTIGELEQLDERDLEWLIDVATRKTSTDARGVRLGVMSLEDVAVFREEHFCAAECEGCQRMVARLSSPLLVPV
jgi:hypothetical protein